MVMIIDDRQRVSMILVYHAVEHCRVIGESVVSNKRTESTSTESSCLHCLACIDTGLSSMSWVVCAKHT